MRGFMALCQAMLSVGLTQSSKKGKISSFSLTLKGRNRHKNASIQSVTLTTTKSHRDLNVPSSHLQFLMSLNVMGHLDSLVWKFWQLSFS